LPPVIQQEIDEACTSLTRDEYDSCAYNYYVVGSNATQASTSIAATVSLVNITLNVTASVSGRVVTVQWTTSPGYSTYLLQYASARSQYWTVLTANNPETFTITTDGIYIFRVCVSYSGNTSSWMYSTQVIVATTSTSYSIPSFPLIVNSVTGSTSYSTLSYFNKTTQASYKSCNCVDSLLAAPSPDSLSIRVDTTAMVVIVSVTDSLDGMLNSSINMLN
jgi:hypothetical protein